MAKGTKGKNNNSLPAQSKLAAPGGSGKSMAKGNKVMGGGKAMSYSKKGK